MATMEFTLTIRLDTDENRKHAAHNNAELVQALRAAADRIERTEYSIAYPIERGIVLADPANERGNAVGDWSIRHGGES